MNIIVDANIFIGVFDKEDLAHKISAVEFNKCLNMPESSLWITTHILDEVLTILQKRNLKEQILGMRSLIEDDVIRILFNSEAQERTLSKSALSLMISQKRTKASFTDLYSVAVIVENILDDCKILSFDKHLKEWSIVF